MRRGLTISVLTFAFLSCFFVFSAATAAEGKPLEKLVERSESILVEVPVHVTLGGKPVRDLTIDNFEIFDRGERQEISGLAVADLSITTAGKMPQIPVELAQAARRHFLLLFDMSFSSANSIRRSQMIMREWVRTNLHPWDLVGVAVYSARTGAHMVLNFTSDRQQVELAITSLGLPQFVDRGLDPLALEIGVPTPNSLSLDAEDPGIRPDGTGTARVDDDSMAALREIYYSVYEPVKQQGERHSLLALTRSMEILADRVRAVRGRKHVVYLSEGFDASLAFPEDDQDENRRMNQAFDAGGAIWRINSSKRFGDVAAQNSINNMIDALRRADCAIQAVQIGAASGRETLASARSDSLYIMADGTGGELYRDFNDLGDVMSTLLEKTSVTYLLTFRPSRFSYDGKYHKLSVKTKGVDGKASVTHRPGYYEPKPGERLTAEQLQMQDAGRIMEGRDGGGTLAASMLASTFHTGDARSYVPVFIEVDGRSLPRDVRDGAMTFDVFLYAVSGDGSIADFFTQRIRLDLSTLGEKLSESGVKLFGELELGPGEYSLRLFVRENRFGLHSTRASQLRVPASGTTRPTLLPPFFPEPRGKWLLARETREGQESEPVPYPFMRKGEPYVPAALPVLAAHAEAEVFLVVYDLGEGPLSVYTEVIDPLGATHDEPKLRLLERTENETASGDQDVLIGRFHPHGLAAGQYTLLVTVANDRTGLAQTNSIPIRVILQERLTETAGGAR